MKLFGKKLKLAILDVDGTILDLLKNFEVNLVQAASLMRLPLKPFHDHMRDLRNGKTSLHVDFEKGVSSFWPHLSGEEIKNFESLFREAECSQPYPPIEGSIETLLRFKELGMSVAVCTSNTESVMLKRFEAAGISPALFDAMSVAGNGCPMKPNKGCLNIIFKSTGYAADQAFYVGDTEADFQTAKNNGVDFFAVLSGGVGCKVFERLGVESDRILNKLSDILTI
ncbi:HAD family hydrolase [Candidatus Giovannonibacteria bacterium]|nr:HAD family hydrolase [Candidatus Giovannonibacteria bacterium]